MSVIFLLFIMLCCLHPFAQQAKLKVTDVKSTKGKIIVIIFKDNKTFKEEKVFHKIEFSKPDSIQPQVTLR
jgi:hypothetical protein